MVSQHELMTTIVPSIGVVVGTLMFLSPLKAVLDMRRSGRLGVRFLRDPYACLLASVRRSLSSPSPNAKERTVRHLYQGY